MLDRAYGVDDGQDFWHEEIEMRARRTWVFLVAGLATIALAIAGCGNSPDDGGDGGSANTPSSEAPASSGGGGGYGY